MNVNRVFPRKRAGSPVRAEDSGDVYGCDEQTRGMVVGRGTRFPGLLRQSAEIKQPQFPWFVLSHQQEETLREMRL